MSAVRRWWKHVCRVALPLALLGGCTTVSETASPPATIAVSPSSPNAHSSMTGPQLDPPLNEAEPGPASVADDPFRAAGSSTVEVGAVVVSTGGVEVVTAAAATGDGGNAWGGHQSRIVRTKAGVFTAYSVVGDGYFDKRWVVARRVGSGRWQPVGTGSAGREPANLLAGPDGTLYLTAWPAGRPTLHTMAWTATGPEWSMQVIPGLPEGNWPYGSAGIDREGNLCVVASVGGDTASGSFITACRPAGASTWTVTHTPTPYRHAYAYVLPEGGGLSLVATRDTTWASLGLDQPDDNPYAFNALGLWYSPAYPDEPIGRTATLEERATKTYPDAFLNAQMDAYLDTEDRVHVLYWRRGESTQGREVLRHRVLDRDGGLVADVALDGDQGWYQRIFQDGDGRYWLFGSNGFLQRLADDGFTPQGRAVRVIDVGDRRIGYSGPAVAVPRTGTARSNIIDIVYPTEDEHSWVYFALALA